MRKSASLYRRDIQNQCNTKGCWGRWARKNQTQVRVQSACGMAERKASSPQTAAVCPSSSSSSRSSWEPGQVLAEEIRDPRKIQILFLKGQCGKDTSQNTATFNIEGTSMAFVRSNLPTFPPAWARAHRD